MPRRPVGVAAQRLEHGRLRFAVLGVLALKLGHAGAQG
jgi:hypothetical protein